LIGVATGVEAIVLALHAFLAPSHHAAGDWAAFTGLVATVALLCSVIGNGLWNYASRALPLALMGQMIVFETVFGALYGFIWEGRWPTPIEGAAMALLLAGVASCAAVHRR
jgi:drug/metabolite transporter (DMT)-like permease